MITPYASKVNGRVEYADVSRDEGGRFAGHTGNSAHDRSLSEHKKKFGQSSSPQAKANANAAKWKADRAAKKKKADWLKNSAG